MDGIGNAVGMVGGAVHDVLKGVQLGQQLIEEILTEGLQHLRLQLAHDAAHVLPARHGAGVGAAIQPAAAAARHAADVVANLVIAHGAGVDAALHRTVGQAHHAADVRIGGNIIHGVELGEAGVIRFGVILKILGVDAAAVFTAGHRAVIFAHHAAGGVFTGDAAGEAAAYQLTAGFVGADEAADAVISDNGAEARAVQDAPGIAAGQQAQIILPVAGVDGARHGEVLHGGAALDIAEQTPHIAAAAQLQAGNFVAVALKRPAEGGDGGKVRPLKVQIIFQNHGLAPRPRIQRAVAGEVHQVLHGFNGDRIFRRQNTGNGQCAHQHGGHQEGGQLFHAGFHCTSPPSSWVSGVTAVSGGSCGESPEAAPSGNLSKLPEDMIAEMSPLTTP